MSDRRESVLALDMSIEQTLASLMLGRQGVGWWSGCFDIQLIARLVAALASCGRLPADAVPVCVWSDPARRCNWVLIGSREFAVADPGAYAPELFTDDDRIERRLGMLTQALPRWAWDAIDADRKAHP